MVLGGAFVNLGVAKTMVARDYTWQIDFLVKSLFQNFTVKYSIEYLTDKEIYKYMCINIYLYIYLFIYL